MASNILSSFLAQSAFAIRSESVSGAAVAKNLKISRIQIKLSAKAMRHMLEDGTTVVDSRIIQPSSMNIESFCPDQDTLNQVNNLLNDRSNFYSVSSKGIVLNQMMIDNEQIRQSPEFMSATPIRISFKQVLTKYTEPVIVSQSTDSSLIDRGMTIISTASKSVSDLYNSIQTLF